MKQLIVFFLMFCSVLMAQAQSRIIGKVDADGVAQFTAAKQDCQDEIKKAAASKGTFSTIKIQELKFSQMATGQYCLTAYEKDAAGKIARGVRVECKQDDDNNLIITPKSRIETTTGKAFASPGVSGSL